MPAGGFSGVEHSFWIEDADTGWPIVRPGSIAAMRAAFERANQRAEQGDYADLGQLAMTGPEFFERTIVKFGQTEDGQPTIDLRTPR